MSRLAKAIAIVIALVLLAPVSDLLLRKGDPVEADSSPAVGLDAATLIKGGDPEKVLARLEEAAGLSDEVPFWFQRELGLPDDARDVRAGGTTVSYVVDGECGWVFDRVKDAMAKAGWTCVPLGHMEGATFLKKNGACTWALATCTQVGSATSVVFRCKVISQ